MAARDLTLADLKTMALGAIDETSSDNHYGSLVTTWINEGLQRMVMEGEGLEFTDSSIVTSSGARAYPIPTPAGSEVTRLKQVLYDGVQIPETQLLTHDFFSSGTGFVDSYAIWNNKILLGPQPPAGGYQVVLYGYRTPAVLSATTDKPEIPDRFRGYLADYATAQMLLADGKMMDAKYYLDSYEAGVRRYMHWTREKSRGNFKTVLNVAE